MSESQIGLYKLKGDRSQTLYTAPCNGIVSHGAQIGDMRVFANHAHTQKQNQNQCVQDLCRPCCVLRMFYLHAQTAVDAVIYLKNQWLFWLRDKPEDPVRLTHLGRRAVYNQDQDRDHQFEPHAGIYMAQVLGISHVCL